MCVCVFTNYTDKTISQLLVEDALALPMFADCTSASIPFSHVVRGRHRGLLQSLGG